MHMTIEPLHTTRVSTSRKRQTSNETMKSLLDMLANVILTVHCPNDSQILCITSHNKLEMTLCIVLCMKVCTDLYSSQSFLCLWITLSLGLYISRRHVSVNVFVLVSENGLFKKHGWFQEHTYVKAGHVWTQSKTSRVLCTTFMLIFCSYFICCLLAQLAKLNGTLYDSHLVLQLKKHYCDNVQFIHILLCT